MSNFESKPHYLYHMVPKDMETGQDGKKILYPLNMLKEKFPHLYEVKIAKYQETRSDGSGDKRKYIPERLIPTLEKAAWGDVLQLTAIHPEDLMKALVTTGFKPKEFKFYQIDPEVLDPQNSTIYLYREELKDTDLGNFTKYDSKNFHEHSVIPEVTKKYYDKVFEQNKTLSSENKEKPLLFVGVPHIFHKGPIDVSDFPVITVKSDAVSAV